MNLTNTAQEWLSNVFDVIVFMQHIDMMLQLLYSASSGETQTQQVSKKHANTHAQKSSKIEEQTKNISNQPNYVKARRAHVGHIAL